MFSQAGTNMKNLYAYIHMYTFCVYVNIFTYILYTYIVTYNYMYCHMFFLSCAITIQRLENVSLASSTVAYISLCNSTGYTSVRMQNTCTGIAPLTFPMHHFWELFHHAMLSVYNLMSDFNLSVKSMLGFQYNLLRVWSLFNCCTGHICI